jgi:hypothetical protein
VREADWSTLRPEPGHFVDERLTAQSSDLLFSVRVGAAPVLLYLLFEHQSTVDRWLLLRLLQYMVRIWGQWLRGRGPGDAQRGLPPILPLVLHQGEAGWTVSTQFLDLVEWPAGLRAELERYLPRFEHLLVDLHELPLEEVRGGLVARLVLTLMKAVREGESLAWLERVSLLLLELLRQPDRVELCRTLLLYLAHADPQVTPSTFWDVAGRLQPVEIQKTVMTLAEALIAEGWQKGRQEGQQEGWQKGRQEGLERGALIGRIQACQEVLGLPLTPTETLAHRESEALRAELRTLQVQLSHAGPSQPR